jgi:hypothetical protein
MKKPSRKKKLDKKGDKQTAQKNKSLRGKPVRVPGVDKGKVVIKLDFDSPLPEFEL